VRNILIMINPAEDIVNIWLQDKYNHFTMSNIVVHKKTRNINGKKVGGGRGKEIDFLSTNGKEYFWVEVSVSPNPRLPRKDIRSQEAINNAVGKFADEKMDAIYERFQVRNIKKWFVYSPKLFSRKSNEEALYCAALREKGIKPISFALFLKETHDGINHMGYDVPRQYLFLSKKFGYILKSI